MLRSHYLDGRLSQDDLDERVELALGAGTRGELEALTRDLPQEPQAEHPPAAARPRRKLSVHVIGGLAHEERGRAQDEYVFVAGIGGLDLDLSHAEIPSGGVRVKLYSVIGGAVITVPDGVAVEHAGFSLLGGVDDSTRGAPPGAPLVRVQILSLIGGVAVEPPGGPRRLKRARRGRPELPPPPPPL